MEFNFKDFESRVADNGFCYGTFQRDDKVCWLTSLVGRERAYACYDVDRPCVEIYDPESQFLGYIPYWADSSREYERRENAKVLMEILKRRHSVKEYRQLLLCLRSTLDELQSANDGRLSPGEDSGKAAYTAILFAMEAVSRELVRRRPIAA